MSNPSAPPICSWVTSGRWLTPADTGSISCIGASKSRLNENFRPTSSLHRPTTRMFDSRARAAAQRGQWIAHVDHQGLGALRSMARATSVTTGTLRSARVIPPGPTLSPTGCRMP